MIYKINLIKRKVIRLRKLPDGYDDEKFERLTIEMRRRFQDALDRKRKIIWLDEVLFTKSTNLTHEWSKRLTNIYLPV